MTETRSYQSPLRAEQVEQTRERILGAVAEVLADEAEQELTIPAVARRARVSIRTVYRHFPAKEELFDAWAEWAERNLELVLLSYPDPAELVEMVPRLFRMFDEHETLVRAMLSPRGRELRTRTRRERIRTFEAGMGDVLAALEPDERARALAAVYLVASAPAWLAMREQWGLSGAEAGEAAAWAVSVLIADLVANPDTLKEEPRARLRRASLARAIDPKGGNDDS